ncbi:permease [Sphingomonas sp. ASV193]|uniref:cell division protein FtsX n=1 Tax=Sphingomonas sp. ASV193 TaxID=3144405 RepID=UPI0032E8D7CA
MIGPFAATPPERRLLPAGRGGATAWLLTIMVFVTLVVAAAGLALSASARKVGDGVRHRFLVEVPDGAAALPRLTAALRATPGVTLVAPVPEAEVRATLAQWLGPLARDEAADLPIPALVDVDLAPGADPAPLAAAVRAAAPTATLAANEQRLGPLLGTLNALSLVAAGIVLLVIAAAAAAVILATRSALAAQRGTIEVMHGIGATDAQITRLFQRKIAIEALVGSGIGTAAALVVLLLLVAGGLAGLGQWTGGALLGWPEYAVLAALPAGVVILAAVIARRTVLATLRETL